MGRTRTASAFVAVVLGLAACNTTEGLVPPEEIAGGTGTVSSDNNSSAYTQPNGDIASGPGSYPPAPTSGYGQNQAAGHQAGSLDAQAQSLAAGNGEMQPPPSQYGRNPSLAAASPHQQPGRQPLGTPPQSLQQQAALLQPMPAQPPAAQQDAPVQQPAALPAGNTNTIRFLPIIGAPVEAVTPLSRQLGAEARANGLVIKSSGDTASAQILKGYFSAFSDSGKVTIVYVWDVLDGNGGRLHRIQGQESFASNAADAWSAVPATLMQQIGTKTINEYVAWHRGRAG